MQQITYEQLHNFCEKPDTLQPKLLYPSIAGGRWYATNRRVLISVPKEYVIEDERLYDGCKIEGRYPNVKGVINEEYVRATKGVDISLIKAAFAKLPTVEEEVEQEIPINYIDCPCCHNGEIEISGDVHFKKQWIDVEATVECPVCHGFGKIPDWDDYNPNEDDEYDPDNDTTYVNMVKTGNMIPDYEHGIIVCDGVKCSAAKLKIITDFFDSIGAEEVNYEAKPHNHIIFEYDNIYIMLVWVCVPENEGITAW